MKTKHAKVKAFFLRHGKTNYTGVFPDLTGEGAHQISVAAEEIAANIGTATDIQIISSPLPRAIGSADIIAKKLGVPPQSIKQEPALRCMDFYDADKAGAIWKSFPSARHVDLAYAGDDRFEMGDIVEKRSEIQYRFFEYLGNLIKRFNTGELPEVMIHTSHHEVLWELAASAGFEEPLIHGEVICLELSPIRSQVVCVERVFRNRRASFLLLTPAAAFRKNFYYH